MVSLFLVGDRVSYTVNYSSIDEALDHAFLIGCANSVIYNVDCNIINVIYKPYGVEYKLNYMFSRVRDYCNLKSCFYYVTFRGLVIYASIYRSDCERFIDAQGKDKSPYSLCDFCVDGLDFVSQEEPD